MRLKKIFQILLIAVIANGYSQEARLKKADKEYANYAYINAINTYENVAEKGYKSVDIFQKLGNAYYFNAELIKANKWYEALFNMNEAVDAEYYYRYSQTLKAVQNYAKANEMLAQFNQKSGNDSRAALFMANKNYLADIESNSGRYAIENAGINSEELDYGTSFYGDQLIFTSSRKRIAISQKIQEWNNQPFTSLYSSKVDSDGNLQKPMLFSRKIDSKFNEATPVFTKDGSTMYFTRNNYNDGKRKRDSKSVTLLKIYKATLKNGEFTDVVELPFNSDQYSTAHPALSPDESTLYFVSDMPGSLGQSDLYKVALNKDGSFGTPENLGNKINTEGKETFPYISNDNELYFSSDGHPGLGGLDVFVSKITAAGFEEVINVGKPINSPTDDFAYWIDTKTQTGFFTSNREGGIGFDDIYKFKEIKKLTCEQMLSGIVTDSKTTQVLADSKVTLFDEKMNKIAEVLSNQQGLYSFNTVKCNAIYYVRVEKKDYTTEEKKITISKDSGETKLPFDLDPIVTPVTVGDDLAKVFHIKIIYFDLDKSNIRPDAAVDLAKIVEVMNDNPTMKIDIRSHTDSRQTHQYNASLSDRRAKATLKWMVKQGINANRLTAKGYGETQLVNKCADGVDCTEEEHQLNRRSEFIITAL